MLMQLDVVEEIMMFLGNSLSESDTNVNIRSVGDDNVIEVRLELSKVPGFATELQILRFL